jgi:glycine dehydrogenase
MTSIRGEIARVESGEWGRDDNPLRNAPHTADEVVSDHWNRSYSREIGAFPVERLRRSKYWPPVSRIDGAGGDRNLICACPPLSEYSPD